MSSIVRFENVTDLPHQQQCEQKFRERHERRLAEFCKSVEIKSRDLPSIDYNERPSDRLEEAKKTLEDQRTQREHLHRQIADMSQRLNTLSADNQYLTDSNSDAQIELREFQAEKVSLEKDVELFRNEVRNKYKAFVTAKNWYKEKLNTHFAIDSLPDGDQQITLQLFTSKRSTNACNTIVLIKSQDDTYSLKSTNPTLPMFDSLVTRLKETGDLTGLVCCIRKCFLLYYANKEIIT